MNIREDDEVSAVAIVVEGSGDTAAAVEGEDVAQPAGIPGHELEYVDVPVEDDGATSRDEDPDATRSVGAPPAPRTRSGPSGRLVHCRGPERGGGPYL